VSPRPFVHVFVAADPTLRTVRLAARGDDLSLRLTELESHSTEREVGGFLAQAADIRVDADRPTQEAVVWLVGELERFTGAATAR
jgi:hypothetical protein